MRYSSVFLFTKNALLAFFLMHAGAIYAFSFVNQSVMSQDESFLINKVAECISQGKSSRWPVYQGEFDHKKVLRTIVIPSNPLIQDEYLYRLLRMSHDSYLIERVGGFAGGRSFFGFLKANDFCGCATDHPDPL